MEGNVFVREIDTRMCDTWPGKTICMVIVRCQPVAKVGYVVYQAGEGEDRASRRV